MDIALRNAIADFLAVRRIAVIGVSRDPLHFSRALFRELASRGYDVVPVNPNADDIEGRGAFAQASEVQPPPEAALLFTTGAATDTVVQDCAAAGINRVWMYRAFGDGAVTKSAVEFCRDHSMTVIPGECPFMFLPNAGWPHQFHHAVHRLFGGV